MQHFTLCGISKLGNLKWKIWTTHNMFGMKARAEKNL